MEPLQPTRLSPQSLYAGDTIEYYSQSFVCGDVRGLRKARVLRIAQEDNPDFPVTVDTEEPLPSWNIMRRLSDRFGNQFKPAFAKWRALSTFSLVDGRADLPTRATKLNAVLREAVNAGSAAVAAQLREEREAVVASAQPAHEGDLVSGDDEKVPRTSKLSPNTPENTAECNRGVMQGSASEHTDGGPVIVDLVSDSDVDIQRSDSVSPSTYGVTSTEVSTSDTSAPKGKGADASEGFADRDLQRMPTNELPGGKDGDPQIPTDQEIVDVMAYVRAIPSRYQRAKIRHQPKKRPGQWSVSRSRKPQYQAKCATTRSGNEIYHARTVKAQRIKSLLRMPGVRSRLTNLRARRPTFQHPNTTPTSHPQLEALPWPAEIDSIEECKENGVAFDDIGEYDPCKCIGDCFLDTCTNVASAVYCTPDCCKLQAKCSNAPRTLDTLRLFDTGRVGLGVFTTTDLAIGDVVGEYAGELSEYPALVDGQPEQALKQNSGYTLLYNAKSHKKNFVYVDAQRCGTITRFISHSCDSNAVFVEQQNRSNVKVHVKMIRDVSAGAEITVHYGDERWFVCACDDCWKKKKAKTDDPSDASSSDGADTPS